MKILLVNTVATDKNGITMVIFNYLKAMDTNGITLDLVSLNNPDNMYEDEVERKGGHVYVLPRSGKKILSYWNGLRRLIKQNKYDAVHIHGNSHTVVLELSAIWAAGCKVRMVHSHNTTCTYTGIHKLMTIPFNMLYTHGLACGREAGEWMFGMRPFEIINNGVNTDLFGFKSEVREKMRSELGWCDNKVIGHVGTFISVKNQTFIVDVFSELYKRDSSYRLLLIGEGELRKDLMAKVESLGLKDAVKFTGNVNNVYDYVNAMDLVVMPSLFEGLPLTLVEQQANGLHCVVADTITTESDKTGNLSFLSLEAPISEWADKIQSLDLSGREERSKDAVEKIKVCGYSIQEEAKKLKEYYLRAVEQ